MEIHWSSSGYVAIFITATVRLHEHISSNPQNIVNGFIAAGIPQSIDNHRPTLADESIHISGDDADSDSDNGDYDSDDGDGDYDSDLDSNDGFDDVDDADIDE